MDITVLAAGIHRGGRSYCWLHMNQRSSQPSVPKFQVTADLLSDESGQEQSWKKEDVPSQLLQSSLAHYCRILYAGEAFHLRCRQNVVDDWSWYITDNIKPYNTIQKVGHIPHSALQWGPHALHTDISTDPMEMSSQLSVAPCQSLIVPGEGNLATLLGQNLNIK